MSIASIDNTVGQKSTMFIAGVIFEKYQQTEKLTITSYGRNHNVQINFQLGASGSVDEQLFLHTRSQVVVDFGQKEQDHDDGADYRH